MDHIIADFDLPGSELIVPNLTEQGAIFPKTYEEFQSYPRDNGWRLDDETYNLKLLTRATGKTVDQLPFLQSWLFFGLIMTIVQKNGKPLLGHDKLVEVATCRVTTEHLPEALEKWREWEIERCASGNLSEVRIRMVQVEGVLDAARRTIRANYGHSSATHAQPRSVTDEKSKKRDKIALSLMVLGETLSLFKAQIMKTTQSELKGWHNEDGRGWGPPAWVLEKMRREGWCKRTIHLWQSQLLANATLMLASYMAYNPSVRGRGSEHHACTEADCTIMSKKNENYQSAHTYSCEHDHCSMQGPNMTIIRAHLDAKEIPLLRFDNPPSPGVEDQLGLSILKVPENKTMPTKYATISHVWSDGLGNEKGNELPSCQLKYIRDILNTLDSDNGWATPFWLDTLVIPVGQENRDKTLRKCAIKQIFRVFKESTYTIVLDAGLSDLSPGDPNKPAVAAMRILGSSWMRRLWTLQEAFLSQKIFFAFDHDDQRSHIKDFKDLSEKLGSGNPAKVTTALMDRVNSHLQDLIMSHEHETRDTYLFPEAGSAKSNMPREKAAQLVASSWKAARWRTTSNDFHETLALATLLDLDYENTSIAEQGLQQTDAIAQHESRIREKDKLARIFWTQFNKRWPKSIPPGIIFLPGDRVEVKGFGWAPRTWMTAQPIDHPDPLSLMTPTANMNGQDGLQVRYPGFLLHPQNRRHILATDKNTKKFWFPTDPSFLDWYVVETIDEDNSQAFIHDICESEDRLGIIVSRVKPGSTPAEIGLLVQIREHKTKQMNTGSANVDRRQDPVTGEHQEDTETGGLYCEIVRRVKVSREPKAEFRTRNRAQFLNADDHDTKPTPKQSSIVPEVMIDSADNDGKICLAEELGPEQVWYVDGYFPDRDNPRSLNGGSDAAQPLENSRSTILQLFVGSGRSKKKQPGSSESPKPSQKTGSSKGQHTNPSQSEDPGENKSKRAFTFPGWITHRGSTS